MKDADNWKFIGSAIEGQLFRINGINIWDYKWTSSEIKVNFLDPIYEQQFSFNIYEIESNGMKIKFAAGEFSNLIYGFYQEC
jgi:hypothetical protein